MTEVSRGRHYLLYDVSPGEGFNLRRDAMMRAALLTRRLGPDWTLVLPPFTRMPHWSEESSEGLSPWARFFDLSALGGVVSTMEFDAYQALQGTRVDRVLHLIPDHADLDAPFHASPAALPESSRFTVNGDGGSVRAFGGAVTLETSSIGALSWFAPYTALRSELADARIESVLLDRFEAAFWDGSYGGEEFWRIRSRIRFAAKLRIEADRWRRQEFADRSFLAVHLRRGDAFAAKDVPSTDEVCEQITALREGEGLAGVFLATDAEAGEVDRLTRELGALCYRPGPSERWPDGETAIIEQCIAASATMFVGTATSTFTSVIREEREAAGWPSTSSWNELSRPREVDGVSRYDCAIPIDWPFVGGRG